MSGKKNPSEKTGKLRPSLGRRLLKIVSRLFLSALIIVVALALYGYQMQTSPKVERKRPERQARLVEVMEAHRDDCVTTVMGMGTVIPAKQVTLHPRVTGQIVAISEELIPGGVVDAGQELMHIDPNDYEIIVEQRKSDVTKAQRDLKIEQGNRAIAEREYALLGEIVSEEDKELVLREPQLASAQSALESARAALGRAELDLARCKITAPFNSIIQEKHVDTGATVTMSSELVTLMGTDEAWVEVMIPIHQLKWLTIPRDNGNKGSAVKIYNKNVWGDQKYRTGRVIRLFGDIELEGRMARLLVVVDDPFSLRPENQEQPKLLIGSYVSAEVEGRTLSSVIPVRRSEVRDDETIWVMNDADALEIRKVEIVFRDRDHIYAGDGLVEGERIVVTDIAAPVAGMSLRVDGGGEQTDRTEQQTAAGGASVQ